MEGKSFGKLRFGYQHVCLFFSFGPFALSLLSSLSSLPKRRFRKSQKDRMVIGKIYRSLEILGTRPGMTKGWRGEGSLTRARKVLKLFDKSKKRLIGDKRNKRPLQCHPPASGDQGRHKLPEWW